MFNFVFLGIVGQKPGFGIVGAGMSDPVHGSVERLELYLARVKLAVDSGNRAKALSDLAELGEIARRLWVLLSKPR